MSRRRVYSADTLAIMERFYAAVDIAVQNKLVKNINVFCTENSIDRGHFYAQRKDLGRDCFRRDGSCRSSVIAASPLLGC